MGYTTEFKGAFYLDRQLTAEHCLYLRRFTSTRRMKRDSTKVLALLDPERAPVVLKAGTEGC